jgi:hypothetical protein
VRNLSITAAGLVAVAAIAFALVGPHAAKSEPAESWVDRVAALNCAAGEVPGWLDEDGLPTSCVSNNPCPEVEAGQPCPGDIPAEPVPAPAPQPKSAPIPAPVSTAQPAPAKPESGCN